MPLPEYKPEIICFFSDLIIHSRIEAEAERLGLAVCWVDTVVEFGIGDWQFDNQFFSEPTSGPGSILVDILSLKAPVGLLFDLGNPLIPWDQWIPIIKSSPAVRRIPIICFGSRMDLSSLDRAKLLGADLVFSREGLLSNLEELIGENVYLPDLAGYQFSCQQSLSDKALHGLELFNNGAYFEAHEALEEAWKEDETIGREIYRAILQIAVAYLQIERCNYNGAVKMFWRSRQWLAPLSDTCRGIDISRLSIDAERAYQELIHLGRAKIKDFDRSLLRPVNYLY